MDIEVKKIDALQAMRAFAAILVMFFHGTAIIGRELNYNFANGFFYIGFVGVDVFFVLSGFIIFYTSKPTSFNIPEFFKKRFIRIYPIYWIVISGLILQYFISPTPDKAFKGDPEVILASATLFPHEVLIVGVAWTLTYEVIFYLMFGLTFAISRKFFFRSFACWSVIIVICYFFNIKSQFFAINALINPIILEFGFGCLIAYLYQNIKYFNYWKWAVAIGGILLAADIVVIYFALKNDPAAFSAGIHRVYLFGIPSTILIFGLLYFDKPVYKLLVMLGDASYSVYLIHGTVISTTAQILAKIHLKNIVNNMGGAILIFAFTLAVGRVFYLLVEKPLVRFLRPTKEASVTKRLNFSKNNSI